MDKHLVIHISLTRYKALKVQGIIGAGETEFHLLDSDYAHCTHCNDYRTSVVADTPADLDNLKALLTNGPFPTITIDRNGAPLDLNTLDYLNRHIEEVKRQSDYQRVSVSIARLPVERYAIGVHQTCIAWPSKVGELFADVVR